MQYDKPYRSTQELIDILIHDHHLTIIDREKAEHILNFIPYYDLVNGYKDHFMDENDTFIDETSIEDLYAFHMFDRGFQNILFEFSVIIEDYFKNILAQTLAKNCGVAHMDYLSPQYYIPHKKALHRDALLKKLIRSAEEPQDNPSRFYAQNHNHIPPWILLKNVTFSNAINLYMLLKRDYKNEITNRLIPGNYPVDQKFPIALYALTVIRKFRNVIAHNLKFTTFNCQRYNNNLNKEVLKHFISPNLISPKDLHNKVIFGGIYGYIVLAFSLIPDRLTKLELIDKLAQYIVGNSTTRSNAEARQFWDNLARKYCMLTNIPHALIHYLFEYGHELVLDEDTYIL